MIQHQVLVYIDMCKSLVDEEFSDDKKSYKDIKKMKKKIVEVVKDIEDESYLKELNKQILKISMLDKTNLETVRKNKKLYLTLSK